MAKNWIQVGKTDYYLKSDRLNWIVARRVKCKKSKSHPEGYKYTGESYHPKLHHAFERIFEEMIKLAPAETMEDILRVCDETYSMLRRVLEYEFKGAKSAA